MKWSDRLQELLEARFGGSFSVGPVTVYGFNAMHVAVNIRTRRWGYVCFHPPLYFWRRWWPAYFYVSPNATPWAATFMLGGDRRDRELAPIRRVAFGHNFDCDAHYDLLCRINGISPDPRDEE